MFCILDIESSGGPFGKEAMIEIAVYRYDGQEVVDQLISLVHPHREVQQYVSRMTGITPKMLVRAPRFQEIAKRIVEITEDTILVGHNVEFDYRMLRQEFARLGYPFVRETLDTIETAQVLIPGLASYGLDKICTELGIFRTNKHRADDDARATLELFKILQEKDQKKDISILGQSVLKGDHLKDKINDLLRSVKISRGLYYLHDMEGKLLYLGASDNIKSSLNRLFLTDTKKAEELRDKVYSLKTESIGNWLIARIKKMQELQNAKPPYNKFAEPKLERGIYVDARLEPPALVQLEISTAGRKKPLVKSINQKLSTRALGMFGRNFKAEGKREAVLKVLSDFPQEAIFQGKGRNRSERCAFIVKNGHLSGYFYYSLSDQISHPDQLEKSMTPVEPNEMYTELLKLGILSGEFVKVEF